MKFLRFAQWKMEQVPEGIVGVITNHSWLDNPTFKGMRKSLMETFDQLWVLDLHGNAKKKERVPTGGKDENVFDIEQGVAIAIFVKRQGLENPGAAHAELWGSRLEKYHALANADLATVSWTLTYPEAPHWSAKPTDSAAAGAYRQLWSLPEIFAPIGDPAPGFVTTQDEFAISFTPEEAQEKVAALLSTETEADARRMFQLCKQDQWDYGRAKRELSLIAIDELTVEITFRPFDNRWTIWDRNVCVHRRERAMNFMLAHNLSIISHRLTKDEPSVFVTDVPARHKAGTRYDISYVFPLYMGSRENLGAAFRQWLEERLKAYYNPEEVLGYIYAVLHAPTFRTRYAEFLRIDFPRIPFPESAEDFEALSRLGWALVEAHLLHPSLPRRGLAAYVGKGDDRVEAVRRDAADGTVWISAAQGFRPVPAEVWEFRIGGYQVLDKYLKSRKGRMLSLDEIRHVARICDALAFTIEQMTRIDAAYRAAFPSQE